jgi:hypothetical protein
LAYQPPASSTFLSDQTSHQQPANSTFLSEQISTSHQPPAKRTGWLSGALGEANTQFLQINIFIFYLFIYNVTSTFCLRSKPFNENINYRKFIIGTAFTLL